MAVTYVDIQDRYFINPATGADVLVNVVIGNGQTGGYLIFEDKIILAANRTANFKAADKLDGKRCLVSATIIDMLNETNWTSVTINVQCNDAIKTYGPYSKEAPAHLDTVCYTISILFQLQS